MQTSFIEEHVVVAAPEQVLYDLVLDVVGWTQFHPPAIHAEVRDPGEKGDLVEQWALLSDQSVRRWRARRTFDQAEHRIAFVNDSVSPCTVSGSWTFQPIAENSTRVTMSHQLEFTESVAGDLVRRLSAASQRNTLAYLATLKDTAEREEQLQRLVVSFEDALFVGGSIEHVYDYLYRADRWPERIPHVRALTLNEDTPNIQFFDMQTAGPDGSTHNTRSVRVCLPPDRIVYKQLQLPPLLDAHTGHWKFTETTEGVHAAVRHTVTIKPTALHLLGDGTTIIDARKYLRRELAANSMTNLRLAKSFAEELAGV
ncbi:aromatase/cyclase [Nocardia sp. NPDC046473]|uniref:aromatase/cyclase n=1 Tax=Nocardia sp. NPDC046473 TaxID=3155733 RepID=UPI0033DF6ACA